MKEAQAGWALTEDEVTFLKLFQSVPQTVQWELLGTLTFCFQQAQERFLKNLFSAGEAVSFNPVQGMDIYEDPFRDFKPGRTFEEADEPSE